MRTATIVSLVLSSLLAASPASADSSRDERCKDKNDAPTALVDARLDKRSTLKGCVGSHDEADAFRFPVKNDDVSRIYQITVRADFDIDLDLANETRDKVIREVVKADGKSFVTTVSVKNKDLIVRVFNRRSKNNHYSLSIKNLGPKRSEKKGDNLKSDKPAPRPAPNTATRKRKKITCPEFGKDSRPFYDKATEIGFGKLTGCMPYNDEDGFVFTIPKGEAATFAIRNENSAGTMRFYLYDVSSGSGGETTKALGSFAQTAYSLKPGRTYFLKLKTYSTETVKYTIAIKRAKKKHASK